MAKTLSIVMLCFCLMLVLLGEIQASSPASQKQGQGSNHANGMYGATQGSLRPQECNPRCTARCSATAFKKPCMFFCQKCCAKCLCVPPGTYGNKQYCPCYNNWKTKRGGPKCP
ncbi:Gibberellin regulated protein [Corchorus olitorius]|uniref:Gibberellin regulated protein n=1 Tax=Corchorus olitorius TaxID=93759 RepID=A0A1R3G8L4_9ROSI|nr:Gibberellin regulated protein [Corchorus olitorius]